MIATFCVVMRICMKVRVNDSRPADDMQMGKEIRIRVVTHKDHYEKG